MACGPNEKRVVDIAAAQSLSEQSNSQYLVFEHHQPAERKTPIVFVLSKSSGVRLGTISWFGRWRQFCFWPSPETVFNVGCMTEIQAKIAELRAERSSS